LCFAYVAEREADRWVGVFTHLDLVIVTPGAVTREVDPGQPAPLQPQSLPCSSGVTFVATSVLGKARYLRTGFYMVQAFLFALIAMFFFLLLLRICKWVWWPAQDVVLGETAPDGEPGEWGAPQSEESLAKMAQPARLRED